jgi:hypothetical protein
MRRRSTSLLAAVSGGVRIRASAVAFALGASSLVACARYTPPAEPAPRTGTLVHAPPARTWAAVLAYLDSVGAKVSAIDAEHHLVATRVEYLPANPEVLQLADCGKRRGSPRRAEGAAAAIQVRPDSSSGDSARSVVQMDARYAIGARHPVVCASRGVFEARAEAAIKARAERQDGAQ